MSDKLIEALEDIGCGLARIADAIENADVEKELRNVSASVDSVSEEARHIRSYIYDLGVIISEGNKP